MRDAGRLVVVTVLAGLLVVLTGTVGWAHTELISSDPVDGAVVEASPERVTVSFNEDVQPGFSVITVVGPDGKQYESGTVTEQGTAASTTVRPLPAPGEYTVGYRVLSADSHVVEGSVRFEFTGAGATPSASAPAPATPPEAGAPAAAAVRDDGPPVWPWIVAVLVLLAGGVVLALRLGRAR